jgi:SAM-dependent methyltransferase
MSYYLGRHAELYDLFYSDKPYAAEARFVHEQLCRFATSQPQRILELACGTGSHALELARLGCFVTATDASEGMLKVAEGKAKAAALEVVFRACDMRELPAPEAPYDAAICLFDSIGYVGDDENIGRVLDGVHANLAEDGIFVLEFWHAPTMRGRYEPLRVRRFETNAGTLLRLSETSLVPDAPQARVKYDVFELREDGTYDHFTETQTNRFFTVAEMVQLAQRHGFEPIAFYPGYVAEGPITDEVWHVVGIWKRNGERALPRPETV